MLSVLPKNTTQMSLVRAQTHTSRSADGRTNHEATAPIQQLDYELRILNFFFS